MRTSESTNGEPLALALTDRARALVQARSRLRHSRLENQLLNRQAATIAERYRVPSPARDIFEDKIRPDGEFFLIVREARELCQEMIDAINPRSLLDLEPLASLPEQTRTSLADMLDRMYAEASRIGAIKQTLGAAVDEFERVLQAFVEVWYREPPAPHAMVQAHFEKLQLAGQRLHGALGQVPQGVVIP